MKTESKEKILQTVNRIKYDHVKYVQTNSYYVQINISYDLCLTHE